MRASSATIGTNTSFAESPGPRKPPTTATSPSSTGKLSSSRAYSKGMRPTASALTTSATMLTRRGPTRSTIGPVRALATTYGANSQNATRPVCAALPVDTSTNQGIAIAETRVPVRATA